MDVREVKPITPQEAEEARKNAVPSFVIEAVNKLLKKRWDGQKAIITQEEIISEMKPSSVLGLMNGISFRRQVFSKLDMDFANSIVRNDWTKENCQYPEVKEGVVCKRSTLMKGQRLPMCKIKTNWWLTELHNNFSEEQCKLLE